jgi:hypothetical protein
MENRIQRSVALSVCAVALVVQVVAVRADGGGRHGRVSVTFTKWVIGGGPFMLGVTGGDIEGVFAGEVFANVASQRVPSRVNRLEVIYEVQADDASHSFTALIRGGQGKPNAVPPGSRAFLDGRVVLGWRTGAPVHAEWVAKPSPSVDCPAPPAGAGPVCFVGTITVERADHDDDDDDR